MTQAMETQIRDRIQQAIGNKVFPGCVVCDVQKGLAFTLLSNFVHPKRKPDATLINEARKDIADIILKP
jgi:hypothetical protein